VTEGAKEEGPGVGYDSGKSLCFRVRREGAEATCGYIDPSLTRLCRVKTCHGGGSGSR
jgi:hypothetical protein